MTRLIPNPGKSPLNKSNYKILNIHQILTLTSSTFATELIRKHLSPRIKDFPPSTVQHFPTKFQSVFICFHQAEASHLLKCVCTKISFCRTTPSVRHRHIRQDTLRVSPRTFEFSRPVSKRRSTTMSRSNYRIKIRGKAWGAWKLVKFYYISKLLLFYVNVL